MSVVPLGLSDTVLVVAMPQRIFPWRPQALVRLADDETGAASSDGASVAISVVSLAADAALLLEAASEYTLRWGVDHRWPAGGDLRTVDFGFWVRLVRSGRLTCFPFGSWSP